jgi:SAM-dependent methyltransferase
VKDDYYLDPRVAEAYDAETIVRDDIPFYVELAKEAAARGESVLELACGTGRVTIPIAQAGLNVVGLDRSPAMLDVARRKAEGVDFPHPNPLPEGEGITPENPRWVEGDMSKFELGERYGLVIIPARSLLLLLTVAEEKSCLRCVREHLVDGGRLALNIFNPDLVLMASWMTTKQGLWRREPESGPTRDVLVTRDYRTADQAIDERYIDTELSDQGAVIARVERNLRLRYVFRYEMEHLLALSGFEVEALYGWFDKRPFDDESSEMVWLARKPKSQDKNY